MFEVIRMQQTQTETPDDQKASNVSYAACNNSFQSQAWCWRW